MCINFQHFCPFRPPFLFPIDVQPNKMTGNSSSSNNSHHHHDDDAFSAPGYVCAVSVPLLSAIVSILTRQLKDVHASVLMFWFGVGAFVVGVGGEGS